MQKQFTSLIFTVISLFFLPQMASAHMWEHAYKLVNIERIDISELNDKHIVAIEQEGINIYVLTADKHFYILNSNKVTYKYTLDFLDEPLDMRCDWDGCLIAHETNGLNEIFNIKGFLTKHHALVVQKWAILDDININKIVSKTTDLDKNYTKHKFIIKDTSNKLYFLTCKLNIAPEFFFLASNRYTQGIYVDVVKKVIVKRDEPSNLTKHLENLFNAYKIGAIEMEYESFNEHLLTIVNNSAITYAKINVASTDAYENNAIKAAYTITHNKNIKEVLLHFKDLDVVDKVIFLSNDDHQLYTADVEKTIMKKTMDEIENFLQVLSSVILYYIMVVFD